MSTDEPITIVPYLTLGTKITGKFHQNPLRNIRGIVESRTSVDKMAKTDKGP